MYFTLRNTVFKRSMAGLLVKAGEIETLETSILQSLHGGPKVAGEEEKGQGGAYSILFLNRRLLMVRSVVPMTARAAS